jgi:hypothetical protein
MRGVSGLGLPLSLIATGAPWQTIYGHLMDPDAASRAECRAMYRAAAEVCAEMGMVTELEYQYGARKIPCRCSIRIRS